MAAMDILQTLWGAAQQTDRLLRLSTPLGADVLLAENVDGWEAVDHGGFRFELHALSANASLSLDPLLGAPVLLELLTADSRTDLRPFHGYVTHAERVGSNAGMARYCLTIEPWLSLLKQRKDSFAFRDLTVIEIVEQIFGYYAQGGIVPAWQWQLADRSIYSKRSLTSQYQESDYDFVTRLLAEEGIFYWFEHSGDTSSPGLGKHTMLLADSNTAFQAGSATAVRFHRADGTETTDTIQVWTPTRRWQTGQISRASWDYRTLSNRPSGAQAAAPAVNAVDDDTAGPYAYANSDEGQRRAQQHLDARHVSSLLIEGEGTVRRLAPGHCFQLVEHPTQDNQPLVCLRVQHEARNNLGADVRGAIEHTLGDVFAVLPSAAASANSSTSQNDKPDLYRNTFIATSASRSYRPHTDDGHGLRRHPAPTVTGAQSAVVVGDGEPIHTDRDHRVKVQQHWQRGENGASGLSHPRDPNAPADGSAGTWARVGSIFAGGNWGGVSPPRVGQEVWLNYLEGDIDRPVVVATLYNGQGNQDAANNQIAGGAAGATGNAAAWFTGNDHAGVLSGIKSQDLSTSTSGSGGYRQLRFDDTPGQSHAQLATTDDETALTLGHIKQLSDNERQADLGYGASLATLTQGALRGGSGLLLTSAPGGAQMDVGATQSLLGQSQQTVQGLTEVAQKQQAGLPNEPSPEQVNAVASLTDTSQHLSATRQGNAAANGIGGGEGAAIGWSAPLVTAHGQDGLALLTPQHHVWVSGTDTVFSAGQDINLATQGKASVVAAKGIALYTQGSQPAAGRPVTTQGIALHAASGSVSVQAQNDQAQFAAQKSVSVTSAQGSITTQGNSHVLLTAAGAYLKLQGSNIEIGSPGDAEFHAGSKELTGPQGASGQGTSNQPALKDCPKQTSSAAAAGAAVV
ncbi:type VI secretion system Vgr family protein [Dyella acidiphila]|uniref:Type VI secretion system tip protein VgrG n=1 Tax=Dyella acidiphila TaxID=2775866 RepID=A0ABR9GAM4_9GAMM|nr:type VI secretion system Vgr family protein [Dyella acidiphila]MBE1161103.1 type VI secretion system tip protein VgrG [Dyella acidiphila]